MDFKKRDTVVGNDVWIGSEAMIMPGVQIGDGAVTEVVLWLQKMLNLIQL